MSWLSVYSVCQNMSVVCQCLCTKSSVNVSQVITRAVPPWCQMRNVHYLFYRHQHSTLQRPSLNFHMQPGIYNVHGLARLARGVTLMFAI